MYSTPELGSVDLNGVDPELLKSHLEAIGRHWDAIADHDPGYGYGYWKTLSLANLAVHLSGGTVWSRNSLTGGVSATSGNRQLAKSYLNIVTERKLFERYGIESHQDRILVGLGSRVFSHAIRPTHPGAEVGEVILQSMRLGDMDSTSQGLIRTIFGPSPLFETELVRG